MDYTGNNCALIAGTIEEDFELSHRIYGEDFYLSTIKIPRLSGTFDYIKILVSERLIDDCCCKKGDTVEIEGQFRSYNSFNETSNKLILTVFAKDIRIVNEEDIKNPNSLYLNGYICKEPIYRVTPFGREITDMLLAVNRTYNKSDYIPIIAWGRNARFGKNLKVGEHIKVKGRIQSRNYQKKLSEDEIVTRTAYEVSISRIERADEEHADGDDSVTEEI